MKTQKKCDQYGFKLKEVSIDRGRTFTSVGALYTNFHTNEQANFSIRVANKSFIYDMTKTAEIKSKLEGKDIVEGLMYLIENKNEKDSIQSLISQLPESIMFNHREVVAKIISKNQGNEQQSAAIKKAFQQRYKILTDAMTGKVR